MKVLRDYELKLLELNPGRFKELSKDIEILLDKYGSQPVLLRYLVARLVLEGEL